MEIQTTGCRGAETPVSFEPSLEGKDFAVSCAAQKTFPRLLGHEFPRLLGREFPRLLDRKFPRLLSSSEFPRLLGQEFPRLLGREFPRLLGSHLAGIAA